MLSNDGTSNQTPLQCSHSLPAVAPIETDRISIRQRGQRPGGDSQYLQMGSLAEVAAPHLGQLTDSESTIPILAFRSRNHWRGPARRQATKYTKDFPFMFSVTCHPAHHSPFTIYDSPGCPPLWRRWRRITVRIAKQDDATKLDDSTNQASAVIEQ